MRVLLVEPYYTGSHRAWADGYRRFSSHDIRMLTMSGRWWKWRMRGAMITVAEEARQLHAEGYFPDVILATDMVDVAALKGVLPWQGIPVVVYFHETQLTYPDSPLSEPDLSYALTNWTSSFAATRVVFNSDFHLKSFFANLPRLLRHFPDYRHDHLIPEVLSKAEVIPVGVDLSWVQPSKDRSRDPLVLWNHRWEHDKNPDEFLRAVEECRGCRVALCGESFGNEDQRFEDAREKLGERLEWFGFAPLNEYRNLLNQADVVVSTARQEFFGISVVEAMAAGAFPVLPNRLSYPELVPSEVHDKVFYPDGGLREALEQGVSNSSLRREVTAVTALSMRRYDWPQVAPRLDRILAP